MDQVLSLVLWGGAMFLMMRFGCGAHMFGHRHGNKDQQGHEDHAGVQHGHGCCSSSLHQAHAKDVDAAADVPQSHHDPVCGKEVSAEKAKTAFHAGKIHYFCSRECREVFEAAPDTYLSVPDEPRALPPARHIGHVPQAGSRRHRIPVTADSAQSGPVAAEEPSKRADDMRPGAD